MMDTYRKARHSWGLLVRSIFCQRHQFIDGERHHITGDCRHDSRHNDWLKPDRPKSATPAAAKNFRHAGDTGPKIAARFEPVA